MSIISCFDAASMVIDDMKKKTGLEADSEKVDILREYCEAFDELCQEFEAESFDVEMDEKTMNMVISIECIYIVVKEKKHRFFDLAERAIKCSFSATEDGFLIATFVYPPIWKG